MKNSWFEIISASGAARRGRLTTNHGIVETPAFIPVGTAGSVKAVDFSDLESAGAQIFLANTYHLFLRPGTDVLRQHGGFHSFAGATLPLLTDSGGYQVMSLSNFREIAEEGVHFVSHLDGRKIFLTPEEAVRIQNDIASDIQMMLDVCPAATAPADEVLRATDLSLRWAERTLACETAPGVLRFGITQGGLTTEGRRASTEKTVAFPFDGFGIGGLSVGEEEPVMMEMLDVSVEYLPKEKPRYLMGVGKPSQIIKAVARGVDLFDCVLSTRVARHGTLWTTKGILKINRLENRDSYEPVDAGCSCLTCRRYSRAYLRHLLRCADPLYYRLASIHNLVYMFDLMRDIRAALEEDGERWVDLVRRDRIIEP